MSPKDAGLLIGIKPAQVRHLCRAKKIKAKVRKSFDGHISYDISEQEAIKYRESDKPKGGWKKGRPRKVRSV